MKRGFLILGIFVAFLTACQDDNVAPGPDPTSPNTEKTEAVKGALKVMSSLQGLDRLGFSSPSLFNGGMGFQANGRENGISNGRLSLTTARMAGDTTDNGGGDGEDDWTTCAEQEFTDNGDGTYSWVLDYGVDGCEEYGYFMKGKMIETYGGDGDSFSSKLEYFGFGNEYYTQDGTSEYSGTWTLDAEGANSPQDSAGWSVSGEYTHKEDLTISISEEDFNETFTYKAEGSQEFDEKGSTEKAGFRKYTASNGDFYNTTIDTPLYFSYECISEDSESWIFVQVSGTESTTYQEGDVAGEFSINYGDGTCDNIITVTENGESYDIDLGEQWEDEWEDDDDNG